MLEVQLANTTAPFLLVSKLRPSMAASEARRTYVVNVSAMEGVFGRGYKGPGHPHTNMAKAAVNMLTRTSAREMFETDRILMTSVDTGWITDERPHPTKVRLAEEGFHAPLDLVDGAARVYDPIVRGEAGEDLFGVFLRTTRPAPGDPRRGRLAPFDARSGRLADDDRRRQRGGIVVREAEQRAGAAIQCQARRRHPAYGDGARLGDRDGWFLSIEAQTVLRRLIDTRARIRCGALCLFNGTDVLLNDKDKDRLHHG